MNILIDTTPLTNGNSIRGVGTYTRELLRSLREVVDPKTTKIFATHEDVTLSAKVRHDADIIHYPYFDLFFPTLPFPGKKPFVITIHDVIPLVYPDQYKPGIKGSLFFQWQKWVAQKADAIITDSQASQLDIARHLGILEHKIHVVPLAGKADVVAQSEYYRNKFTEGLVLPEKYVVYVGDINYNKNVPTLLLALTELPDLHLVVVSQTFKNKSIPEGKRIWEVIRENDLEERVHVVAIPHDAPETLASVLQGAKCLVQPSLYEGFGLPVLEAMQSRTIVVSSNGGSLPEVAGSAAILVEPTIIGLQQGIEDAMRLRGDEREKRLDVAQKWSQEFSWKKTAENTLTVYESVLQGSL